MTCKVCGDSGYLLVVHVVSEVLHASPVPCAGPEEQGCQLRIAMRAEDPAKWAEWRKYLRGRDAVSGDPVALAELAEANLELRRWRGRYHDRRPGEIVVGDREAQWLTAYVRGAREEPRGAPVSDGDLPGLVILGEWCGWDPGKAAPDEGRYRVELAASVERRDVAAKARDLARGMTP